MASSRTLYLPVMIAVAVAVACAVALSALSEKAEATFPGKNGRIAYAGWNRGSLRGLEPRERLRDLHYQPRREWQETTHQQQHGRLLPCLLA